MDWLGKAEKSWDGFSKDWSRNAKEMWETGSRKSILPWIKNHLAEHSSICDLGCGEGYACWKLSQEGYKVTGVDLSGEMVEKAKQKTAGSGHLEFIQADIAKTPFEDGEFDAVLAVNSIEWTEDPLAALMEAGRIIKPGGTAVAAILGPTAAPRQAHSYRRLYKEPVIMNSILPWEFERLSKENGWELIGELGVEKKGVDFSSLGFLSKELKQALSFMWVFMLKKKT